MLHVALTGNVAAGKSAVARLFARWGATVIDADALVREVQQPGSPVLARIAERFGPGVIRSDGSLDRGALRARVFSDAAARADLEAIVHPAVAERRAALLADAARRCADVVVSDIPLLFEVLDPAAFDGVVLVDAPVPVRRERLVRDRGLEPAEADRLIAAQLPADAKRPRSTWIIENDADLATLERRARAVWDAIRARLTPSGAPPIVPPANPSTRSATVSNVPEELRYTAEHEYVRRTDDPAVVVVGITDYAQGELGDIVFVNLPKAGESFGGHQPFGTIEAVKAVSELYTPLAGEVVEVNPALDADPAVVNRDPYGDGWMVRLRVSDPAALDGLLSADAYRKHIGE